MGVKCFMLHETGRFRLAMRRFTFGSNDTCPKSPYGGGHEAITGVLEVMENRPVEEEDGRKYWSYIPDDRWSRDDSRWPARCQFCDYNFVVTDQWQCYSVEEWQAEDDRVFAIGGRIAQLGLPAAPAGAMWYSDWVGAWARGPDGRSLNVVCPDGTEWLIDGPASNCTKQDDRGPFGQAHRCWVRHGTPPNVTVDKSGLTCSAGGGSIMGRKGYHGFLRNGEFT
jgi:hypothetical protein